MTLGQGPALPGLDLATCEVGASRSGLPVSLCSFKEVILVAAQPRACRTMALRVAGLSHPCSQQAPGKSGLG